MTSLDTNSNSNTPRGMFGPLLLLALAMTAATALDAWRGFANDGNNGLLAAIVAGVVCMLAAGVALTVGMLLHNTPMGIHAMLGGTLIRTGVPLAAGVVLQEQGGALAEGHVFSHVLVLFLCALVVETGLLWRWIHSHAAPTTVRPTATPAQAKVA